MTRNFYLNIIINIKIIIPDGGDCANFASQILHEGAGFKKNSVWNYAGKDGTKAWLNAQGFKNYLISSGRASYIDKVPIQNL